EPLRRVAHLTRRHLLAAADDGVVARRAEELRRRAIEQVEEAAAAQAAFQLGADRRGLPVALLRRQAAEPARGVEGGDLAAQRSTFGAADAGAVAGDGDALDGRSEPAIDARHEAMLGLVEIMGAAGGIGQVDARDHALMEQQRVAGDRFRAAAARDLYLRQAILAGGG